QFCAAASRYPPALTGLRGQHAGSFEVAHALVREGRTFSIAALAPEEHYDLIVVGAGISGLAAAYFYRQSVGRPVRILILDNHDDFGGHAKRNEFSVDGRLILAYGGTESLQSPKGLYSSVAKNLLKDLGVEIARFEKAFDRGVYASLGLSRGIFFDRPRSAAMHWSAATRPHRLPMMPASAGTPKRSASSLPSSRFPRPRRSSSSGSMSETRISSRGGRPPQRSLS